MITKKDLIGDTTKKEWSQLLKEILFLPVLILLMWYIGTNLSVFFVKEEPNIEDLIAERVNIELHYYFQSDEFKKLVHEMK